MVCDQTTTSCLCTEEHARHWWYMPFQTTVCNAYNENYKQTAGQTTDYSLAQRELQELVCRNVLRVLVYELHCRVTAL